MSGKDPSFTIYLPSGQVLRNMHVHGAGCIADRTRVERIIRLANKGRPDSWTWVYQLDEQGQRINEHCVNLAGAELAEESI